MYELTAVGALALVGTGMIAGSLGGLLGIGGGVFITPALVYLFDIPVHWAVPASLVCVAAASLSSGPRHYLSGACNNRLGVLLALGAAVGGVAGALLGKSISARVVLLVLSATALLAALVSALAPEPAEDPPAVFAGEGPDQWPGTLGGTYLAAGGSVPYEAKRPLAGITIAAISGLAGSIAGVGGGFVNVPQMRVVMGLPARVAAATSSFVIGVSAAAGLVIYLRSDLVSPLLAAPLLVGSTLGAMIGSALMAKFRGQWLHWLLIGILVALGLQVGWSAIAG